MGQPAEVRVLRGDVIHGPFTPDQVRDLFARGRLADADMASVWNGPWTPVAAYLGARPLPPAPPPPSATLTPPEWEHSGPRPAPAGRPMEWSPTLLWAYRGLLVLALVGIVGPWYTASSSVDTGFGSGGSRVSVSGLLVAWGLLAIPGVAGGIATSFLLRSWQVHCGAAGTVAGLAALAAVQLSSAAPFEVNYESSFGGATASARSGLGWGGWLTLAAGAAAALAAFCTGNPAARRWLDQRSPAAGPTRHTPPDHRQDPNRVGPGGPAAGSPPPKWLLGVVLLGVVAAAVALGGSHILDQLTPVTRANYDRLRPGTKLAEAEAVLGGGEDVDTGAVGVPGQTVTVGGPGGVRIPGATAHVPGHGSVSAPGRSVGGGGDATITAPGASISSRTLRWRFLSREITAKFINGELLEKRQGGPRPRQPSVRRWGRGQSRWFGRATNIFPPRRAGS